MGAAGVKKRASKAVRAFAHGKEVELTPTMRAALAAVGNPGGKVCLLALPDAGLVEEPVAPGRAGRTWSVKVDRFVDLIIDNLAACYHRDWRLVERAA